MRDSRCMLAVVALVIGLSSCVGDEQSKPTFEEGFDFLAMTTHYADKIIVPNYLSVRDLLNAEVSVDRAIAEYCESIDTAEEGVKLEAAQTTWRNIMSRWQLTELHNLGPVQDNEFALRNAIYSYGSSLPSNSCGIDQSVVLAQNADFDIKKRLHSTRGLDALEYLLFNTNLTHTCSAQISQLANWNTLGEVERKRQRCHYAQKVVVDVAESAEAVVAAWAFESGDFRTQFVNPDLVGVTIKSLSDSLFYLTLDTKDLKLGVPIGVHGNCTQTACPEQVESQYSQTSLAHIRQNLMAFKTIFNGADGLGFDDILTGKDSAALADKINQNVDLSVGLIDQMTDSLLVQAQRQFDSGDDSACKNSIANPDSGGEGTVPVCRLYGYLKNIEIDLESDFLNVVNLDLPVRGQSDND